MDIKFPNLPPWAYWALAAATVWGLHRGLSDAASGAGRVVGRVGDAFADVVEDADDFADDAKQKWHGMGQGTRAAMPLVALGTGLILWKGRK